MPDGDPKAAGTDFVHVAVPLPLPEPLTYSTPEALRSVVRPGSRVRVRVGRKTHVGIVVGVTTERPDLHRILPIEELLDREPILTAEMLELADFISSYYLSSPGETLRALWPGRLPAWSERKVRLSKRGAFATTVGPELRDLLDRLLESGQQRLGDLVVELGVEIESTVERLEQEGLIASEKPRRPGRYRRAVELPAGRLDDQLAACGRSAKGRAVVEYLAAISRPATAREITAEVGCGEGVVRGLVQKDVLRTFIQLERHSLERHRLGERTVPDFELNEDQSHALEEILAALKGGTYRGFLLKGLTSSGKTEVYLRAVDATLAQGRSAILLVPEISLVPALATEARRRFGESLAILHSGLSLSERAQEWQRVRDGSARVVLGPRSAVLAPVDNLGLVVVDEEQDSSFKQDSVPRYNGRDVALVRARRNEATAILASATPSAETRHNHAVGKLERLELKRRVGSGSLPEGVLVDLREEKGVSRRPGDLRFSARLCEEIEVALTRGEQIILLRNRRGYAPVLQCRACGDKFECEDCGLPRTLHLRDRRLVCHYCASKLPVPNRCSVCGQRAFDPVGAGTERVEETFRGLFPGAAVDVLDSDAQRRSGGVAAVLERFATGETQVLIGTQMVSKGHHFPRVSLTGVLSADAYLGFPDFRAVEKTYALLTQLGGRAGRGETPGRLVIQTYHPHHYAIRAALENDDEAFAEEELRFRRTFQYPPYTRLVQLLFRGRNQSRTEQRARAAARAIYSHPLSAECRISGPAPAPLERLQGHWRFQLLIRQPSAQRIRTLLKEALADEPTADRIVDVDPQGLM